MGWEGDAGEQILPSHHFLVVNTEKRLLGSIRMKGHRLTPGDSYSSRKTEQEKKHLAVTNQNELRNEVVRYNMPNWRREKNWIKTKKVGSLKERFQLAARQNKQFREKPCTRSPLYSNFPTSWRKLTTRHLRKIRKVRNEKSGQWT